MAVIALAVGLVSGAASADTLTLRQGLNGYSGAVDLFVTASGGGVGGSTSNSMDYTNAGTTRKVIDIWGNTVSSPYDTTVTYAQGLLKFDLSDLPAGATITSATLRLRFHNDYEALRVFRVTTAWDPGTVTWNTFGTGLPGGTASSGGITPGHDTLASPDLSSPVTLGLGVHTFDVAAAVAAWAANPSSNLGWAFLQENPNRGMFVASEDTFDQVDRPTLTIEYTVNAIPEPGAVSLLGLAIVATLRRRR
jgi:hypothetical protein